MNTTSHMDRVKGRAQAAPEALLLTRTKLVGRFFIDDIKINRQLLGAEGFTLKTQVWTSRVIWS